MKKLPVLIILLCFLTAYAKAQTLYSATATGMKDKVVGFFEDGKIYSATRFGLKDKIVGFFDAGKIFRATKFQQKDKVAAFIDGNTLYYASSFEMKDKPAAIFEGDKVYATNIGLSKGSVIGFYSGGDKQGAACAAVLLILR